MNQRLSKLFAFDGLEWGGFEGLIESNQKGEGL